MREHEAVDAYKPQSNSFPLRRPHYQKLKIPHERLFLKLTEIALLIGASANATNLAHTYIKHKGRQEQIIHRVPRQAKHPILRDLAKKNRLHSRSAHFTTSIQETPATIETNVFLMVRSSFLICSKDRIHHT